MCACVRGGGGGGWEGRADCCSAPQSEPCSLSCRFDLGRLYSDISDSESESQLCARPRWSYAALRPCGGQRRGRVGWDRIYKGVCGEGSAHLECTAKNKDMRNASRWLHSRYSHTVHTDARIHMQMAVMQGGWVQAWVATTACWPQTDWR